ncbi:hypothetical protein LNV08_18635 [Paucibacter sp. TC2R-5]|uniref:M56 family metallopeptidase n=1 Tax=Paucibacter sp. TC2R-5 TaxID=2893555 RepID=UPI0021E421F8|nr:M56 family metallopeptidase [Paucibacter sp. TC2R-5]MCV2360996.1 hypothetical protein [Paucibacter sp. TC2R-5]
MMASPEQILSLLWRLSLALSVGLALVLMLRSPLRRWLGAQAQYGLWALPLLMVAGVAAAPGLATHINDLPPLQLPTVAMQMWRASAADDWWTLLAAFAASLGPPVLQASLLLAVWALGALALGLLSWAQHRAYRGRLRRGQGVWLAPAGSSPALLGCWQAQLVLPLDFEQRFNAEERGLILAHEQGHAARRDNAARLLACVLAALQWFNPLVWLALSRLRQDQELACDARVLASRPGAWPLYAQTLLKVQGFAAVPPLATAWQSTHPLIERITMLKIHHVPASPLRRLGGHALLLGLALASFGVAAALAQKEASPQTKKSSAVKASEVCSVMPKPEVPEQNIQGEFLLNARFAISQGGKVEQIKIVGDERLAQPVRKAIEGYKCSPGSKDGVFVEQKFHFSFE